MSLREDGSYRCDRCGTDVGNAGIDQCAIVTDLNEEGTSPIQLHLCRKAQDGAPRGCAARVLGPGTLADYTQTRK